MLGKLVKGLSLWSSALFALTIMIFFYDMQGYTPADDKAMMTSVGVILGIGLTYLLVEYLDTMMGAGLTPVEVSMETLLSYLPLVAFGSVATAWWFGNIVVSDFQLGAGALFLAVVLIDVFGFSTKIFQNLAGLFGGLSFGKSAAAPSAQAKK